MKSITISPVIGVVFVLLIGVLAGGLIWREAQKESSIGIPEWIMGKPASEFPKPTGISEEEKAKIEAWIIENDLNQYGDPKNIFYTGGTPLVDEKTGSSIDKYEYILKNHPDRPWLK